MAVLIHRHSVPVRGPDGTEYRALVFGGARQDGTWHGWIEFVPTSGREHRLRTDQETSQPDRKAVEYWAGGLEKVYLEGALDRALRQPSVFG
jgi:hypothetical protein